MITIKEIAELAGVSNTTVSNVIHGKTKKVSAQNIEKIKKLLDEYKYVQPLGLNALKNRSSRMIGVIILAAKHYDSTVIANSFYANIIGTLEKCIRNAGYYMMLYSSEDIEEIFRIFAAWNVDGLLVVSFQENDYQKLRQLLGKPVVGIDLYGIGKEPVYNVGLDDEAGGYQMTKFLLERGFRKIKFLLNRDIGVDHLRWRGYRQALFENGITYKNEDLILVSDYRDKRIQEYNKFRNFLNQDVALFFASDFYAIEFMGYFQSRGIRIPEQISVAGFDDDEYAEIVHPRLTTVHQPMAKKAEYAFEILLHLLKDEPVEKSNVILPTQLSIRKSVGVAGAKNE